MMHKIRGNMMRKIRNNKNLKVLSTAALLGVAALGLTMPSGAKEVYPGVNIPDEVYKTEYGDKENYSEIKYYKWTTDESGAKILQEGTSSDNDLKYYVSSKKDTVTDISGVIKDNQNGGDINKNFIDLTLDNKTNAIKNAVDYEIGKINADFVNSGGNTLIYSQGNTGAMNITAINNKNLVVNLNNKDATISSITGNFIGNSGGNSASIYITAGTVDKISGYFIGNRTTTAANAGTAISLNNTAYTHVGSIEGVFIDNYDVNRGGAISNSGIIDSIKGIFINNYGGSEASAIWQYGTVGSIEGYFEGNKGAYAIFAYQRGILGGAKYNIGSINGIFKNNDGAIYISGQKVNTINGTFIDNKDAAVNNGWGSPTINSVTGHFEANKLAICNGTANSTIHNISGYFINNYTDGNASAIRNRGTLGTKDAEGNVTGGIIDSTFIKNSATSKDSDILGGALYNIGTIGEIKNSTFTGNHATSATGTALGGAIYSTQSLNIIADNGQSIFKDNYTQSGNQKDDNAIYLDNPDATLNFHLKNNGTIAMYDNIRGASVKVTETDEDGNEIVDEDGNALTSTKHYSVNITGDGTGTFGMYNNIYDANVTLGNTNLNTVNNLTHTYNFNSLTIKDNTNLSLDVDLKNKEMDRFTANNYGEHNGTLNVIGMNLLSDAIDNTTEIYFAEQGLKDNVTNKSGELPDKYQTAYTPIYKYTVSYDNREDGGYFVFNRGGLNGGTPSNPSDAFNPAVLSAPVATTAATQATINETFKYVFEHADAFTQLPSVERLSRINANKYAINNNNKYNGYSTTYNQNMGSLSQRNNSAAWFRPYVTFETMHLKNGPKVNAITYGSLAGFDTDFNEHKHGWHSVGTGYIGYNGSQLNYSGSDTTMNGGLLGYTHTFYKGNFWSALTATAGASVGQSKTMYGNEDFTTLMAGLGSKSGYNFEFKQGKYILQPIMFMSYTFANTFDYSNAAGVKINNSPAHSIQLNPSIRFIANTKNGWQPYASVGMVWNLLNESKVTANNTKLPEMSMKPYVEYGLGLQRNWNDKFTAFTQAMIRNGGRNGIALTAGFRWSLGKDTTEKVQKNTNKKLTRNTIPALDGIGSKGEGVNTYQAKKVLKQLSPSQKTALGAKPQNTTRTTNNAILKQL